MSLRHLLPYIAVFTAQEGDDALGSCDVLRVLKVLGLLRLLSRGRVLPKLSRIFSHVSLEVILRFSILGVSMIYVNQILMLCIIWTKSALSSPIRRYIGARTELGS